MFSIRLCAAGKNVCSGHAQRMSYVPGVHMSPKGMQMWDDEDIGRCFLGDPIRDIRLEEDLLEYVRDNKAEVKDRLGFVMHPMEEGDLKIFKTEQMLDRVDASNVTHRSRERVKAQKRNAAERLLDAPNVTPRTFVRRMCKRLCIEIP